MLVIVPRLPVPDSVEQLLRRRLSDSTWPVAISFGEGSRPARHWDVR